MPPTALALQVDSLPTVPYGVPCLIKLSMIRLYFDIELYMQKKNEASFLPCMHMRQGSPKVKSLDTLGKKDASVHILTLMIF